MTTSTKGYDDARSVLWVKPGAYFKVDGHQAIFRRLGTGFEPGSREEAHITKPWTTVACVILNDGEGQESLFHISYLPVRTDVTITDERGHALVDSKCPGSCGHVFRTREALKGHLENCPSTSWPCTRTLCPTCKGFGPAPKGVCPACKGTGKLPEASMSQVGFPMAECPRCKAEYRIEKNSGIRLCWNCEHPVDAHGKNEVTS